MRTWLLAILLTLSARGGGRCWVSAASPPIPPCIPGGPADAPNCYQLLDVPITASTKQIKKAYRRRALSVHPYKCGANCGTEANKQFVDLAFAYETLSDESTRGRYERGGGAWAPKADERNGDGDGSTDEIYGTHSDAWARSQFDLARDPLLTVRGWATLAALCVVGILGDRSLRAADIRAKQRLRSNNVALTAERGVRSAAHARERDEQRKAHASITNDRQRREHRRRELREAIHAAWNTPEELSALLSEESVDEIGPKSAPRALPERVTALLRETREIAAASNKLANTAAKVAMRASFETDGEGDAAALAGEKVAGSDADASMAAMVRAVRSRVAANAWESSVVGEEHLRQALIAWGKDAHAVDKEWTRVKTEGETNGRRSDDPSEELRALAESLREWGRLSREFGRLVLELVGHARRCAVAVAAADRMRAAAEANTSDGGTVVVPWTKGEKATLKAAMAKYPKGHTRRWEMVAREFEGSRTVDEIRRFVAEMIVAVRNKDAVLGAMPKDK